MQKRRNILLLIPLLSLCLTGCQVKGVSADEWLLSQYDSIPTIRYFCADLDDIMATYITDAMSLEDFRSEMDMAATIYNTMLTERNDEDIRPGTYTTVSKKAHDGYEQMWIDMGDMLTVYLQSSDDVLLDKNQVAYIYMAYGNKMQEDMNDYYAGYQAAGGTEQNQQINSGTAETGE